MVALAGSNNGPTRRSRLHRQLGRRARDAPSDARAPQLDLRRLRPRRRTGRGVLQLDRDGEDARPRSEAYLTHVLERIANHPVNRVAELLPWKVTGIKPRLDQRLAA